jgi:hypothetical protein
LDGRTELGIEIFKRKQLEKACENQEGNWEMNHHGMQAAKKMPQPEICSGV